MSYNRNAKLPYSEQFRQQMVELVGAGRKPSELTKEFGCHETSILSWVRRAAASVESRASVAPGLHANERAELLALRPENRQIKLERDILAKAGQSLQEEAIRCPRHLHADCSQPGRTTRGCHVRSP
jgi:transposase